MGLTSARAERVNSRTRRRTRDSDSVAFSRDGGPSRADAAGVPRYLDSTSVPESSTATALYSVAPPDPAGFDSVPAAHALASADARREALMCEQDETLSSEPPAETADATRHTTGASSTGSSPSTRTAAFSGTGSSVDLASMPEEVTSSSRPERTRRADGDGEERSEEGAAAGPDEGASLDGEGETGTEDGVSAEGGETEAGADGGAGEGGGGGASAATPGEGGDAGMSTAADDPLAALATGDIALIDTELAEHQRWGAASERVGAADSADRASFIVNQAGAGALGGFGHGALMGAAVGAGTQAVEIGVARLVGRLAGPALARSFPLPAIGAVIGGVFSAYDLATRDWGRTGETIGRFGEGGSIYEQLANSIAAVSEIIGIATAVLNVIAGVIGAISIAMWVITVLTVGVATPLAATLSTIAGAIGIATMVLDGINALVLQRLVTLFRALHTFTSQADPSDVEAQGGRIGEAAGASAGFFGGMAGGLAGAGLTGGAARRLGIHEPPPRVADVDPPRPAAGDGPTITAEPPPAVDGLPGNGDRPAMLPPEPTGTPHRVTDAAPSPSTSSTMPGVDPLAPTMPAVDPHGSTIPAADPHAPTAIPDGPGGMPEIPGPPRVPDIGPLPDYGPELPGWNPDAPSPYAPTDVPPPPSSRPAGDPHAPTMPAVDPHGPTMPVVDPHGGTVPVADPLASTAPAPEGPAASPRRIADTASAAGGAAPADYHPQGWVPPAVDVPPPGHSPVDPGPPLAPGETRNPADAFVPDQPALGENWPYNEPVPDRANVGTNVQRDHVIAQAKLRDLTQGPPDARAPAGALRPIDQGHVLTVLAETGAATPTRPALPHTEVTFHGPNADVPQINNLRAGGGTGNVSADIVVPSREARIAAGYPESAVDRGWVDQLGRAGDQYRLGEVNEALAGLERAEGRLATPDAPLDVAALDRELNAAFPDQPVSGTTPREPPVWAVMDPISGEPRPATGAEVMDAIARDRRGEPPGPGQAVLVPRESVAPGGPAGRPPSGGSTAPHPIAESPRPVTDAPTRSTRALTPAEFDAHARMLSEQYGVPIERVRPGDYTAFHPGATPADGYITIGPDVNPLPAGERPTGLANPANAALEPQAVLAHESLGHRDAELAGQVRPPDTRPGVADPSWHEEFQASTRAALLDPTLPADQFRALRDDAAARLRHRPDDGTIYVWTEPLNPADRPAVPSAPRPDAHFRPQDQQPSVIINLNAAGPGSPGATGDAPRGAGPVASEGGGGAPRPAVDPNLTPPAPVLTGRSPTPEGIIIEEFGRPGVDNLSGLDVDATVAALDPGANGRPGATSDTYFEYPAGRDVRPGVLPAHGLQDVSIRINPDPTKIQYHENMDFSGVTQVRMADAGSLAPGERGATAGRAGTPHTAGNVLPDDPSRVLCTAVPQYGPNSSKAGQPLPLEARMHSANPSPTLVANSPNAHSRFNHTVQINTGKNTRYLLPDGRWVPMNSPDIGPAHYPVGGRDRGPSGLGEVPGIPGGVPTPRPIADPGRVSATTAPSAATAGAASVPVLPPADMTGAHLPGGGAVPAATAGTRSVNAVRRGVGGSGGADLAGGLGAGPGGAPVAAATAPRAAGTRSSVAFTRAARTAAAGFIDIAAPGARALHGAYFGSGTRESRIERGGTVGMVLGGLAGGPAGAYVGQAVGAGVARRAEDFNAGMERGAQPIVEPVNPAYPPPPGSSRQEIADMQNRLLAILQARAQAEALEGLMCSDAERHEANSEPLAEFNTRTTETITATEAHEQAVAQRTAANASQSSEEGNVTSTIRDYSNRAAGLEMIKTPLEGFTAFTYLAHALPDDPDVLRGAKRGILQMNTDGQNFLEALNGVDSAVAEQETAQPERTEAIAENAGRLEETSSAATASQGQLGTAQGSGEALASRNDERAADSRSRQAQAAQTGSQLDGQADQTRTEIADLSAQWQAWAQAHRQARVDAMAQTRAAMIARGWRPTEENSGMP